jgi:hypothetical protein
VDTLYVKPEHLILLYLTLNDVRLHCIVMSRNNCVPTTLCSCTSATLTRSLSQLVSILSQGVGGEGDRHCHCLLIFFGGQQLTAGYQTGGSLSASLRLLISRKQIVTNTVKKRETETSLTKTCCVRGDNVAFSITASCRWRVFQKQYCVDNTVMKAIMFFRHTIRANTTGMWAHQRYSQSQSYCHVAANLSR